MKKILTTVLVVVLAGALGFVGYKYNSLKTQVFTTTEAEYSSVIIEEQISKISELVSLEYVYTNSEKTNDEYIQLFHKWNIPFTDKHLIVKYDGIIKYSTDLSKAKVQLNGNNLTISIAACTISSHEINEDSWEYLDSKSGLFNHLEPEDGDELRKHAKSDMEKRAKELKLVDQANESAVLQLEQMLKAIYSDLNVKVVVQS